MLRESEINREYRNRNPEKTKAHTAINNAIRYGKMTKLPCEVCGEIKVEGHHEDYSKPLEVIWLCKEHHEKTHHPKSISKNYIKKEKIPRIKEIKGKRRNVNSTYMTHLTKIQELRDSGKTYQQIADVLGISRSQVYKVANNTSYD